MWVHVTCDWDWIRVWEVCLRTIKSGKRYHNLQMWCLMSVCDFPVGCVSPSCRHFLFSFREPAAVCSISCLREKYCKVTPAAAGEFLESAAALTCRDLSSLFYFFPSEERRLSKMLMIDMVSCRALVIRNTRLPAQPARISTWELKACSSVCNPPISNSQPNFCQT